MNFSVFRRREVELDNIHLVSIRLATRIDLNLLREWKNANQKSFFHQEHISASQQEAWFKGYLERGRDYMFIAELDGCFRFGCLGCRYTSDNEWDIYNVINGSPLSRGRGYMSAALQLLISFCDCRPLAKIRLKVLKSNPAQHWYKKNGFTVIGSEELFLLMEYDRG